MINQAMVNIAMQFIFDLPEEDGLVTRQSKTNQSGDEVVVLAVEYPKQTLLLDFVFDSESKQDEAYALLLAHGPKLLRYFAEKAIKGEEERSDILTAFETVFYSMRRENVELKERIRELELLSQDKNDSPTVGEK